MLPDQSALSRVQVHTHRHTHDADNEAKELESSVQVEPPTAQAIHSAETGNHDTKWNKKAPCQAHEPAMYLQSEALCLLKGLLLWIDLCCSKGQHSKQSCNFQQIAHSLT